MPNPSPFKPAEVTKADVMASALMAHHLKQILDDAHRLRIPNETLCQALCASAGIGMAQVYDRPSAASRRALAKWVVALRGAFRVATGEIEPKGGA